MKLPELPHGNAALAVHPSVAGFGWALFDSPLGIVDWAVSNAAKRRRGAERKNAECLARIEELIEMYRPAIVLLEAFEGAGTRRSARVQKLCRGIISLAAVHGIRVRIISRAAIARSLALSGARTRQETADTVSSFLNEIQIRRPEKRKAWHPEQFSMALFSAAALGIVHYANPSEPL